MPNANNYPPASFPGPAQPAFPLPQGLIPLPSENRFPPANFPEHTQPILPLGTTPINFPPNNFPQNNIPPTNFPGTTLPPNSFPPNIVSPLPQLPAPSSDPNYQPSYNPIMNPMMNPMMNQMMNPMMNPMNSQFPNPNQMMNFSNAPPQSRPLNQEALTFEIVPMNYETIEIFQKYNLYIKIVDAFPGAYSEFSGANIKIYAQARDLPTIVNKVKDLCKKFDFDPNARWCYLKEDGKYELYQDDINYRIEAEYKRIFLELVDENYNNYSKKIGFTKICINFDVEFARIGGVHRQIQRKAADTIRPVKRQAKNEDLNKGFIIKYRWLWKHESGQFRPYEDDAIFLIEQSHIEWLNKGGKQNANQTIALIQGINEKTYKMSFANMQQQNEITGFPREIRREDIP